MMRIEKLMLNRWPIFLSFALAVAVTIGIVSLARSSFLAGLVAHTSAEPVAVADSAGIGADRAMSEAEYRTLLDGWREGNLIREGQRNTGQLETNVASSSLLLQSPAVPATGAGGPEVARVVPETLPKATSATVAVPNLRGLTYVQAIEELHALGLITERDEETNPTVPAEVILQQSPIAGETVAAASQVTLIVSLGNHLRLPDVYGLPEREAISLLVAKGLRVPPWGINYQGRNTDIPDATLRQVCAGCVLSVRPQVGSLVPIGSEVYLAVRSE